MRRMTNRAQSKVVPLSRSGARKDRSPTGRPIVRGASDLSDLLLRLRLFFCVMDGAKERLSRGRRRDFTT
jgi:hypothetical protein